MYYEILTFCFLCSITTLLMVPLLLYFIYRFCSLFVEFKLLQERVDFLEDCFKHEINNRVKVMLDEFNNRGD